MKTKILLFAFAIANSFCIAQTVEFIEPRNVQSVPQADFFTYAVKDNFYVLQDKFRMQAAIMHDL